MTLNDFGIIVGAIIGILGAPYFGLGYVLIVVGYPLFGALSIIISLTTTKK